MRITRRMARELLEVLDEVREQHFRGQKKAYPHSEWERQREVVRRRLRALPLYVRRAVATIKTPAKARGRPQKAVLEEKVLLFLLTRLLTKSNRGMEELLELFGPLFNFNVSYKYIERLYGDEGVQMALHNLFVLLIHEAGSSGHFVSDGSGYSLTIHRLYRSDPRKHGRAYRYVSRILDIETNMYVAYGWSLVSEMAAFKQAVAMLEQLGLEISSLAADKYYSSRRVIELFGREVTLYLVPKRSMAHIGLRWADVFRKAMANPMAFLSRYFMRNLSESGYSADKRRWGGVVRQRKEDRQDAALGSLAILHNLYAFRVKF